MQFDDSEDKAIARAVTSLPTVLPLKGALALHTHVDFGVQTIGPIKTGVTITHSVLVRGQTPVQNSLSLDEHRALTEVTSSLRVDSASNGAKAEYYKRVVERLHVELEKSRREEEKARKEFDVERSSGRLLQIALDEKTEALRKMTEHCAKIEKEMENVNKALASVQAQYDVVNADNTVMKSELKRLNQRLDSAEARLWLGAIVAQVNQHARAVVFTPAREAAGQLHTDYPHINTIRQKIAALSPEERARLQQVDGLVAKFEKGLRSKPSFGQLAFDWMKYRRDDAHPSLIEDEDGNLAPPTDDQLVDLIVGNLGGKKPFPSKEKLEADVRATLTGLRELAHLNGADENPFDPDFFRQPR